MDNNADEQSLVEKTIETVKGIATSVTDAAKSAIGPKPDPEQVAGTTNEQLNAPSEPGLAIARQTFMEEVVATAAIPKKKRKAPVRPEPPKKSAAKKSSKKVAKKAAKKSSKKSAKKTKSSAGRKAVGKNKTVKKVAKKKKAKKSKR
jgi:hypothetical protein